MTQFFDWTELATPEIVDRLRSLAGVPAGEAVAALPSALGALFASLGELPLYDGGFGEAERTALSTALLERVLLRGLAAAGFPRLPTGTLNREPDDLPLEDEVIPIPRVLVNLASAAALEPLPVIGEELAKKIVDERITSGAYTSIDDLVERVSGLGDDARARLRDAFSYLPPMEAEVAIRASELDFDSAFAALFARIHRPSASERLIALLESLATTCATAPVREVNDQPPLTRGPGALPAFVPADYVGVLSNSRYYFKLPEIFDASESTIDISMFHIAFPSEGHPTRALLERLVAAKERGVEVRVLLDRDRDSDPYLSTVINTPAKEYLEAAGIACRFDREDKLLHSKLIIIDRKRVVIGSHNWSAGSYFQFHDLSLLVASEPYAEAVATRFDAQWDAAF
jgi:hypothetical protein